MPFEHGTYFTAADDRKARAFLDTQGLSPRQAAEIRAWHRSQLGRQLMVWATAGTCAGIGLGYLFARIF